MADGTSYSEEQKRTVQHFDEHSDYWREVYENKRSVGRRLTRCPIKEVSKLRMNQCVIPQRFVNRLEHHGFGKVNYHALTFGPMMPFGLRLVSEENSIRISEKIVHTLNGKLGWMGTILVYDAWRTS